MKKYLNLSWPFLTIGLVMIVSFWPFFSQGKIPVGGDILLGQYYPWLDLKWDNRSTIFPVLNNTIADSIFSFYPWKYKSIEMIKNGSFPIYDASTYMGSELFATGTTGFFYPLNILFLFLDFNLSWGIISASTVFLSATFFYIWLRKKSLEKMPVLIISIAYAFSAFIGLQVTFINTAHSVLWLPLVLFLIDKLLEKFRISFFLLLIFSLFASLNAGFFQGSLYVFVTAFLYAAFMFWSSKNLYRYLGVLSGFVFSIMLSAIQILPFLQSISQSSRLANYGSTGQQSEIFEFFVKPYFFLTTFFPDFFGNPGKGNYFGQFGYYEFNNFTGTIAVISAVFGLTLIRKQKEVLFFTIALLISILFASSNPISAIPYEFSWPIISSLIPARLLVISQFSLLVISCYGLNLIYTRKINLKKFWVLLIPLILFYSAVFITAFVNSKGISDIFNTSWMRWDISLRNTALPGITLITMLVLLFLYLKLKHRIFFAALVVVTCFELIKQTSYFRPFIKPELIFPKTEVTDFLENNLNGNRFMILGQDLIPTNTQLVYNFKIVDGEGPIYPKKHGDFMAGINFENIGDELPQFRRMIYFRNPDTKLLGLLNIKYVVSSKELDNSSLKLVLDKEKTKVYENTSLLPRAWPVDEIIQINDPVTTMKTLTSSEFDPSKTATVTDSEARYLKFEEGELSIQEFYQKNNVINFKTNGTGEKLVVISEQFYPDWKLFIDGQEDKPIPVDYNLLGVRLPAGSHQVNLRFEMESFRVGKIVSLITLGLLVVGTLTLKVLRLPKKT